MEVGTQDNKTIWTKKRREEEKGRANTPARKHVKKHLRRLDRGKKLRERFGEFTKKRVLIWALQGENRGKKRPGRSLEEVKDNKERKGDSNK